MHLGSTWIPSCDYPAGTTFLMSGFTWTLTLISPSSTYLFLVLCCTKELCVASESWDYTVMGTARGGKGRGGGGKEREGRDTMYGVRGRWIQDGWEGCREPCERWSLDLGYLFFCSAVYFVRCAGHRELCQCRLVGEWVSDGVWRWATMELGHRLFLTARHVMPL